MNKLRLVAVAAGLLASPLAALAQSNVTIYGVLDTFVEYAKGGGSGSRTALESGGVNGSRLGFKGSEDLGGGLKANFQLEHGLLDDTGAVAQGGLFWGRQAWLGLSGGFGSVQVGRQYSPGFFLTAGFDAMDIGYGSASNLGIMKWNANSTGNPRLNNSVSYSTPSLSGFQVNLMGAAGEGQAGRFADGTVTYSGGPLFAGIGYSQQQRFGATPESKNYIVGGSYSFGMFKLMGGYDSLKFDAPVNTTYKSWQVGGQATITPAGVISATYGQGKTDNVNNKAKIYSVGYTYSLSKRTSVYGIYSHIDNAAGAAFGPTGASSGNPYPVMAGKDPSSIALGVRHFF